MIDWVNIVLRTLMCMAFLVLVLRPMMLALVRREPDHEALEELANSAVNSAFKAWSQNADTPAYYQNPELALLVLNHPEMLNVPDKPPVSEAPLTDSSEATDAVSNDPVPSSESGEAAVDQGENKTSAASKPEGQSQDMAVAGESTPVEDDVDPDEQLQQMRDRIKKEQKKAKPTIPTELLNNANSYEDKLMVVRMIVDQERDRVAVTLKRMIQVE
jgi:DNA-binding protein YbaB